MVRVATIVIVVVTGQKQSPTLQSSCTQKMPSITDLTGNILTMHKTLQTSPPTSFMSPGQLQLQGRQDRTYNF